jgi:peptide/nickel transport system substrate-binding protein
LTASPPVLTGRDRVVVGSLLVLLALIGGAIVAQGSVPAPVLPSPVAGGTPSAASPVPDRPLRAGLVGAAPSAINPLLAVSPADQELTALVFSGLVRLGPGQSIVPDLASEWQTADDGRTWTFTLRDGATWHDGAPVTARDVAFTIGVLRDPAWTGPRAASWRDVTVSAVDERTARFELGTPIGGFLQAATLPILPAHLLESVPIEELADHPFNRAPVGSGPYRLVDLAPERALLEPVRRADAEPTAPPTPSPNPADPNATMPPVVPPPAGAGGPADIELRFYPDGEALARAFEAGRLDTASGLEAAEAVRLAGAPDARLLRYPTPRLTAVIFNLRPDRPEFRDARARVALLRAIDRPALVIEAWRGEASMADALIPRVSWAFDRAIPPVAFDPAAAQRGLLAAGWTRDGDRLVAPGKEEPFAFELLSPDVSTNTPAFTAAASIAADWEAIGLTVTPRALPPEELVAERLRTADFDAAVVDIDVGLDPDLYPLLGSTQGTSVGLNLSGLVDRDLDKLLEAARAPGTDAERRAAYRAVQVRLAQRQYVLPIAFRDELVVARDTLVGPTTREIGGIGDRFWDVLSWRLADDR